MYRLVWFAVVLVATAGGRMPPPAEMARSTGVGGKQVSSAHASSSALSMNGATDPTNGVTEPSKKKGVVVGQMGTPPHAAPGTTLRFKQEYAAASSKKGVVNGHQGGAGGCDMCGANTPCPLNCNPPVTGPRAGAGMRFKAATSESASTSGTPYTKALQGTKAFRFAQRASERSQSGYKSTYNAKTGSTSMKSGGGGGMMGGGGSSMKGGMMGGSNMKGGMMGGMMGGMGMGGGFANPYPQYTYNMGYMFNQQWRQQIPWQRQQQGLGAYP